MASEPWWEAFEKFSKKWQLSHRLNGLSEEIAFAAGWNARDAAIRELIDEARKVAHWHTNDPGTERLREILERRVF
jgi:hypothetical protein